MRSLDVLQILLDNLPLDATICRNAHCGHWERSDGRYEPHQHCADCYAPGRPQSSGLVLCDACGRSII